MLRDAHPTESRSQAAFRQATTSKRCSLQPSAWSRRYSGRRPPPRADATPSSGLAPKSEGHGGIVEGSLRRTCDGNAAAVPLLRGRAPDPAGTSPSSCHARHGRYPGVPHLEHGPARDPPAELVLRPLPSQVRFGTRTFCPCQGLRTPSSRRSPRGIAPAPRDHRLGAVVPLGRPIVLVPRYRGPNPAAPAASSWRTCGAQAAAALSRRRAVRCRVRRNHPLSPLVRPGTGPRERWAARYRGFVGLHVIWRNP